MNFDKYDYMFLLAFCLIVIGLLSPYSDTVKAVFVIIGLIIGLYALWVYSKKYDKNIDSNEKMIPEVYYGGGAILVFFGAYLYFFQDEVFWGNIFHLSGAILYLVGYYAQKKSKQDAEKKLNKDIAELKSQAEASKNILSKAWSTIDFKLCSKCKDNFISPMKCNSSGTSMEFACESCGKKTWYSMILKDLDYSGEDILDAWESVLLWNEENYDDEIPVSFKFRKANADEEEDDNEEKRSRHIPQKVRDKVWNRDGGKCVQCGSNKDLEFDHIVPHSEGGANTYRNVQLLCESCNRSKSAKIG